MWRKGKVGSGCEKDTACFEMWGAQARIKEGPLEAHGECDKNSGFLEQRLAPSGQPRKRGSHSCKHKERISTDNLNTLGCRCFPRVPGRRGGALGPLPGAQRGPCQIANL